MTPVARRLVEIAHARAGDKGDKAILMIRAYRAEDWPDLLASLTIEAIAKHFRAEPDAVRVTFVPAIHAATITIQDRLSGGVTRSPRADAHGKTLSGHLLDLLVV